MSSHSSSPDQNNPEMKKRRRGESRTSRDTPRYQCYCDKVYLSYPALYLHLKNKHPECFLNNRKIQVTKFKESITQDGFKILRMEKDSSQMKGDVYIPEHMFKVKNMHYPFPNYHPFPYSSPQNFMMPPMDTKPFYMENPINQMPMHKNIPPVMSGFNSMPLTVPKSISEFKPQSEAPIKVPIAPKQDVLSLLNKYISQKVVEDQLQRREVMEMELLYSLLPKCIKQKSEIIRVWYDMPVKDEELIYSFELKYLEGVLGHFREVYTKIFVQKHQSGDDNGLSKQEKMMRGMVRVNRYFCDVELRKKELKRFEQWLIKKQVIEKVKDNFPL